MTLMESDKEEEVLTLPTESDPLGVYDDYLDRDHITMKYTRTGITIVTNRWRRIWCDHQDICEIDTQHCHIIFDPDTTTKENLKKITARFCVDGECEEREGIHSH